MQSLSNGCISADKVPCPAPLDGRLVVRTCASVISAGTERMLLEFGQANLIGKARQQPEKVRQVLSKIRTDGFAATLDAVRSKLDQPIPLGYCNAGVVLETGLGLIDFKPGDRVVSNGPHAEVVSVANNLCARIPVGVTDDISAFTVVGAIALQGVRLAAPTLGESFVVTGLGLIGLIAVQLLRAHGCRILGIDLDPRKLALARSFGAETVDLSSGEDPIRAAELFSRGRGVDGIIIAAATKSDEPVHQAALMCRKRGRIVLVGVTGLNLSRDDFYKKELTFQVSCSYGPGRYDPAYEERGQDYPHGYVRWTAQRNFEAVLDMMADGRLNVEPLITHRFRFEQAAAAYNLIQSDTPHLGVLLQYSSDAEKPAEKLLARTIRLSQSVNQPKATPCLGVIGAGAYATKVLIPAFRQAGAALGSIASTGGVSAAHAGRKFGFQEITTDVHALIADSRFDTVIIVTRHDSHASLVCEALRSGKNVFVEKPLAVSTHQLDEIEAAYREACAQERMPRLMVGFNRRFAPHVARIKQLLGCSQVPKSFILTINAGKIPSDHWVQDPMIGGGRIIGEACHFIDLLRFLAGAGITRVSGGRNGPDNISFTLNFADGSLGTVHYLTTGDKSFPKERLEVFAGGRILQLDNFRRLRGYGWPGFRSMNLWRQNKGATEMVAAFVNAVREGAPSPIPFEELLEVARVTLQVAAL